MDISSVSASSQAQATTQNQAAVSMLRTSIDAQAQQGADLVKLIDQAGGKGQRVDQYA